MEMKLTIVILSLLLASALVYAGGYEVPLSKGYADTLYCRVNAECNLLLLTLDSLVVKNISVIGEVFNVTMNRVTWNITDSFNVGGDLIAKNITAENYFYKNGQSINDTIIWENTTGTTKLKSSQDIDMQDGDISIKDSDGEYHNISRDLQISDEMSRNITLSGLNGTLDSETGNLTITTLTGENIAVNIDKSESILDRNSDSIIITSGTNESPILNHIVYTNAGNPVLTKRTTLSLKSPSVAAVLQGANFTYVSAAGLATTNNLIGGIFNRFFRDGSTYRSGFEINVSTDMINISTGVISFLFSEIDIILNHSTSVLYVHVHSDGSFHQHDSLNDCVSYNDGSAVSNNKYFNVVIGIAITHDGKGVMYATTQDKPSTEYTKAIDAEVDLEDTINFFPPDEIVSLAYIPIVRVVVRLSGGTNTIQILSNSLLFDDLRGTVTKTSSSPPPSGITSYNDLTEIPWTNSGTDVILTDIGDNVGIGTATPQSELDVNDGTILTNHINVSNRINVNVILPKGSTPSIGSSTRRFITFLSRLDVLNDIVGTGILNISNFFFVNSTNVGIGTSTSSQIFHLLDAGAVEQVIESSDGRAGLQLIGGAAGDVRWDILSGFPAAGDFEIREDGVGPAITITKTTLNVGFGETSPEARLEISEEGVTPFMISNGDNGDGDFVIVTTAGDVGIGTTTPSAKLEINASDSALNIVNGSGSSKFYVNASNGRIGIGTDIPESDVEIVRGFGVRPPIHEETLLRIRNNDDVTDDVQIELISGTSGDAAIFFGDSDNLDQGRIDYQHVEDELSFYTNDRRRVVIDSSGLLSTLFNISIGTTNARAPLTVEHATEAWIQIRNTNTQQDAGIQFVNAGTNKWNLFKTGSAHSLFLKNAGETDNVMTWLQNGIVGIDTATPTIGKLHIEESTSGNVNFFAGDDTAGQTDSIYLKSRTIGGAYAANSDEIGMYLNYYGYQGGTSQFRDTRIYNGRAGHIATFDGSTSRVGIGTTSPSYPLEVSGDISGISIYAEANISATGYVTRTSVFDKSRGNALDFIQDADYYLTNEKIDHKKFYGYAGEFEVTDYSRPVMEFYNETTREKLFDNKTNETLTIYNTATLNTTTHPYTKIEEGVSLNMEVDMLRQSVYDLKTELCVYNDKYNWC